VTQGVRFQHKSTSICWGPAEMRRTINYEARRQLPGRRRGDGSQPEVQPRSRTSRARAGLDFRFNWRRCNSVTVCMTVQESLAIVAAEGDFVLTSCESVKTRHLELEAILRRGNSDRQAVY
jgi:hypothetical protein